MVRDSLAMCYDNGSHSPSTRRPSELPNLSQQNGRCGCVRHQLIYHVYCSTLLTRSRSAGLVLPNAAVALLGKGGAACTLLLIFMAVTSASSAELIAVSSIFTYDMYQTYINPKATGKKLIYMSHACVVGFGFIMAAFSTGLFYAGVSMGYLYLLMGVIVSSAGE